MGYGPTERNEHLKNYTVRQVNNGFVVSREVGDYGRSVDGCTVWIAATPEEAGKIIKTDVAQPKAKSTE